MKSEFDFALIWCKRHYPELFGDWVTEIRLVPAKDFQNGASGLCFYLAGQRSRIEIRRRLVHVSHIIETIIHELTHSMQHKSDSILDHTKREDEAYKAGHEARAKYMDSVGGIRLGA